MPNKTVDNTGETNFRQAGALERLFNRDIGGMPIALIACALSAVIFGGLIAMTAGG